MSAHSMHHLGFVARMVAGEPEGPDVHPAGPPALVELLREWRSAERGLAEVEPGSDAWARLQAEVEQLRQRYQEAFNALNSDPTGSSA
jgi:hypothetical protein